MKAKILFSFLLIFASGFAALSQSVFHFKYRFNNISDNTVYQAFLVSFDDGTGFYRVRYYDEESKQDAIIEMEMKEEVAVINGVEDPTKIYFKGYDPQVISGDKTIKYYPERFWFQLDAATGLFEPWAVTSPDEEGVAQGTFLEKPDLIESKDLTKGFVSYFFLENDNFYENTFAAKTRGLTPDQKKIRLHLILVANTEDIDVGPSSNVDKNRNLKTFKDLSDFLGIGFNPVTIYGEDFSKQKVDNAIQSLQAGPKDIVIFYYSGHGFNNLQKSSVYPDIALSNKGYEDNMANSLSIEEIYNRIKKKGARLNLVISDCCNTDANAKTKVSGDLVTKRSSALGWNLDNCKALFLDEKPMSILMTAATKGEESAGNLVYGGFFTHHFRTAMIDYFGPFHKDVTWDTILSEAKKQTIERADGTKCSKAGEPEKRCQQHPFYRIQYGN